MKILVTGASGFIGSFVTRRFAECGDCVTALTTLILTMTGVEICKPLISWFQSWGFGKIISFHLIIGFR